MNKILALLLLALLWVVPACDDDGDDDKPAPTATLTVTVNYAGVYGGDGTGDYEPGRQGTMKNYVSLFSNPPDTFPADIDDLDTYFYGEYELDGNGVATDITGIAPGDYYIVASYDYRAGGASSTSTLNQADRYAIYDGSTGSPLAAEAEQLTITAAGPNDITFNIERFWELGDEKFCISSLDGNTLNVTVDYSAVANVDGDDNAHVFVYRQLEDNSPRYNILYNGALASGDKDGTITIYNILPGTYNVVCLVDIEGGSNTINTGDYYELIDNARLPGTTEADVEFVGTGGTETLTPDSTINFNIGSQAAWDATP